MCIVMFLIYTNISSAFGMGIDSVSTVCEVNTADTDEGSEKLPQIQNVSTCITSLAS